LIILKRSESSKELYLEKVNQAHERKRWPAIARQNNDCKENSRKSGPRGRKVAE